MKTIGASTAFVERDLEELAGHAFRCARRLGAPLEDAEDIAQEVVFLLVSGAPVASPFRWTAVVVRHRVCRLRRASPAAAAEAAEGQHDPWHGRESWLDVRSALERLPPRARRILGMAAAGHSEREIAAAVSCSVKAVEKSLHKSRCRLRPLAS